MGPPRELIMVSSGAVAEGMKRLGWKTRPKEMHELQAAAAVGQMGLVQMYETKLRDHHVGSAQVLLTHADLADRERYLNARSTLLTLLRLGVVPVINENDTVVNDEIKFGDNDTLGALVANLVDADALRHPDRPEGPVHRRPAQQPCGRSSCTKPARAIRRWKPWPAVRAPRIGKGGMLTKILAAKRAAGSGTSTVIAWGREPNVLLRLTPRRVDWYGAAGAHAQNSRPASNGCWTTCSCPVRCRSMPALRPSCKPLAKACCPSAWWRWSGEFSRGDVIAVRNPEGQEIARGLANYSSAEARLLCKHSSSEIAQVLGYSAEPEMLHRDNMVVLH